MSHLTTEFIYEFLDNMDRRSIIHPRFIFKSKIDKNDPNIKVLLRILDLIHHRYKKRNEKGEKYHYEINFFIHSNILDTIDLYNMNNITLIDYFTFIVIFYNRKDLLKKLPYDPLIALNNSLSYNNYEITNWLINVSKFDSNQLERLMKDVVWNAKTPDVLKPIIKKYGIVYIYTRHKNWIIDLNFKYGSEDEIKSYIKQMMYCITDYKGKNEIKILDYIKELTKNYSDLEWINILNCSNINSQYFCDIFDDKLIRLTESGTKFIKTFQPQTLYLIKRYNLNSNVHLERWVLPDIIISIKRNGFVSYHNNKWLMDKHDFHNKQNIEKEYWKYVKTFDHPKFSSINYGSNGNFMGPITLVFEYLTKWYD